MKAGLSPVPERHGEHAVQPLRGWRDPPARHAFQNYFSVGMAAERPAQRLQLGPELAAVVDLAVVHDDEAPAGGGHGLCAGGGEIDDGEPAETQSKSSCLLVPDSTIIGPTVM